MFPGHNQFQRATPFRHLVIDNALSVDELTELNQMWPDFEGWETEELRRITQQPTGPVAERLTKLSFVKTLEKISGIEGLVPDESWQHGGFYEDFEGHREHIQLGPTTHPSHTALARRLCVILYVTPTNQTTGELELWQGKDYAPWRRSLLIAARYNRMVIFETTPFAWHGHASPLMWGNLTRRHTVSYYYSPYLPENYIEMQRTVYATWT